MVIGYGNTRDRLSLYASGDGGVTEMALKVPEEVVFCFIVFEARGLAHQKEIAEFFNHHDVTVNTTKPSELTPTMLRDKTRHLAIKKTGSLGRSDTVQQNKLKNSVWHQRSQGSSRASSPSAASFGGETKDQQKEVPEITTRIEVEAPTPDTQTENTQHLPPASDVDNSVSAEAAPRNPDPAAPDNAADEADVTRVRHSHAKPAETIPAPEPSMQAPPTPRSFNDIHTEQMPASEDAGAGEMARSPTKSEFQQTDSPVIVNFERSEISPSLVENYVQMDSPTVTTEDRRASTVGSPQASASPSATVVPSSPQRHESLRERQKSIDRSNRASLYSMVLSPSQPEVAVMLDQVKAHRKDVMELASSSGIMGEKYFECVRGYTSIQEPAKAFWKRRFFAIADKTMFMYTNECSRIPSDYLPIDNAVSPPRDAEDE
ncbi:hypothetical protein IWW36_003690, partial [Coemansia brasiliensis]